MAARLSYRDWTPESFGDVIVGHILYFQDPNDRTFTTLIRSHGTFYCLPPDIVMLLSAQQVEDGALVVVEYQPEGYRLAVLCEYRRAAKKQKSMHTAAAEYSSHSKRAELKRSS